MSVLICGSMAYDHIMVFQDQFKNHILPDKVHILNVSFLVPEMRREFGGCAGNIAYNLNLLDTSLALPMATVGKENGWGPLSSYTEGSLFQKPSDPKLRERMIKEFELIKSGF